VSLHWLDLQRHYIRIVATNRQVRIFPGGAYDLRLHVAWCPKYRWPVVGGEVAACLREPVDRKAAEHGRDVIALEVVPDQVHLIMDNPKASASYAANRFKGFTSRALRSEFPHLRSRLPALWSKSYFAGSAGAVSAETVRRHTGTQYERPWRKERSR
jgi:REP-associated tyrosine transposase